MPGFPGQMCGSAFASDGTLFAGDVNYNLYRSDDGGNSFRLIYRFPYQPNSDSMVTGYVWTVYVDSRDALFVSIPGTNRLYRSADGGYSFTQVLSTGSPLNDGFYIGLTEDWSGNLYAATYSNSLYPAEPPLMKSTNGGITWSVVHRFAAVHLHNVKFNPANGYLYVSTGEYAAGYYNADCERVFRSKDQGATWTAVVNRPVDQNVQGASLYLPMLFMGNWVYLGSDQAFLPNWIDRFYDDGSNRAFVPQTVYRFSDANMPVISAVWLGDVALFSTTSEFYDGTARVVATQDGVNWRLIKSVYLPQALHHTNFLTINPHGAAFGSDGANSAFCIVDGGQPPPTPTPTPTPTSPPGGLIFEDGFESGSFSAWTQTGGGGSHTQTVETQNPHHGVYNAKVATGAYSEGWAKKSIPLSPVVYYQQYFKLLTLPTQGNRIYLGTIQSGDSNNNVDVYVENVGGQIYWGAYSSINGVVYHDREALPSNPQAGVYYCLETCRDVSGSRSRLWVDGNLRVDAYRAHVGYANYVYSGISWSSVPATVYVDCVKVSTSYIAPEGVNPTPTPTPPPTATSTPTPTSPPNGYLFTADFEGGNLNEYNPPQGWGTYTATAETNNPYSGSYNAKYTAAASSEGWSSHAIVSSQTTYFRQAVKIGVLPENGKYLLVGCIANSDPSNNAVHPFIYNNNGVYYWGTISIVNGVFYYNTESTPSNPQAGVYYMVEVLRDVANHRTGLWVNGNHRVDTAIWHAGNSNIVCTGITWAESATIVYFDCVRAKTSYIGPEP